MLGRMNILRGFLFLAVMLLLSACHNNDFPQSRYGASLHFTVKSSENIGVTRGIEDLDDDGVVSENEMCFVAEFDS